MAAVPVMQPPPQAAVAAAAASGQAAQEYIVRMPKNNRKRFNVMSFNSALKVDVTSWSQAKLERENNIKEYKLDEDVPKYGAGSEFGREHKEESRRKKHGIIVKKYNPEEQPWILKVGGKGGKKFKGIREGGVTENTSYYVFTQSPDGTFEAFPIEEWYNFTSIHRYKALSAEEAEEEFSRRDKVMNLFSIMLRKRLKNEEEGVVEEGEQKPQGKGKKKKKQGRGSNEFKISDMDDWVSNSDDSEGEDEEREVSDKEESDPKKKKEKGKEKNKKKKKKKDLSDEEALEESDEGDFDDREIDYMSNTSSSDEEPEEEKANREMKGVEDEDALRKLDLSDDEEEQPDQNKEQPETEEQSEEKTTDAKNKKSKKPDGSSGDSSSESSDSDFDDSKFHSAMFMQKAKKRNGSDNSANSSRANTPTKLLDGKEGHKSQKRKLGDVSTPGSKRSKGESQPGTPISFSHEGITEDSVRRYLMRKPMTTTELLQKFKSKKTGMSSEQLVTTIAQILKRLNPEKQIIKGKLYLSIRPGK